MNKEEFDKAKAEENKIAQNKRGRLCVEYIIEKGFNEGAEWAYKWCRNQGLLKKQMELENKWLGEKLLRNKLQSQLAIALEALGVYANAGICGEYGNVNEDRSVAEYAITKIRGEL